MQKGMQAGMMDCKLKLVLSCSTQLPDMQLCISKNGDNETMRECPVTWYLLRLMISPCGWVKLFSPTVPPKILQYDLKIIRVENMALELINLPFRMH